MLPRAQFSILQTLRHAPTARFSELMHPTNLTSDAFKFHIRRLQALGYLRKTRVGTYQLTPQGKEVANNFDHEKRTTLKQPKLSMLITAGRQHDGVTQYLFQQRRRNPYFGFWGLVSGPIPWGQSLEQAAGHELYKQTGVTATMTVRSFLRARDFAANTTTLLEDKLFAVIEATELTGTVTNTWPYGYNHWMTPEELMAQKHFSPTNAVISAIRAGTPYAAQDIFYTQNEY